MFLGLGSSSEASEGSSASEAAGSSGTVSDSESASTARFFEGRADDSRCDTRGGLRRGGGASKEINNQ